MGVCIMSRFAKILTVFSLCIFNVLISSEVKPISSRLLPRAPEWKPSIIENYENGNAKHVLFFDEKENGEEVLVKRITFYEEGKIQIEEDVTQVDPSAKGYEKWKDCNVPHGLSVLYYPTGNVEQVTHYDQGIEHGPRKSFYINGQIKKIESFNRGVYHGLQTSYFEDGTKESEAQCINGNLVGELWRYFSNGKRKEMTTYKNGDLEGSCMQWHENGVVKAKVFYKNGKKTDDGNNPAEIVYDEYHAVKSVKHFQDDIPVGVHHSYHSNGQESDRVPYSEGKINGVVKQFSEEGVLLGEAPHYLGKRVGKHWSKYENGNLKYRADFDDKGVLLAPISEFAENGQKIAEYFIQGDEYQGKFYQWFENGQLKEDCNYKVGKLDGEQIEYFSNGNLAKCYHYKEGKAHGKVQKWYEDGTVAYKSEYADDLIHGEEIYRFSNGEMQSKKFFQKGVAQGLHQTWHDNGSLASLISFKDGKRHGSYKIFNEKNELLQDAYFQDDLAEGTLTISYAKDHPKEIIEYSAGLRNGKALEYWENGNIKIKAYFQKDNLEGLAQGWFEDGKLSFSKFYKEGLPVGEQKEYFPKEQSRDAKTDQLARLTNYNSSGKLHREQKTYFPTGEIQTLISYDNGKLHGMRALWNQQGEILEEAWYNVGKLEGKLLQRDEKGREIICYYEQNRKEGPYEIFHSTSNENGRVKALEATYSKGKLQGEVIEYNEAGAKISSSFYKDDKKEGTAHLFDNRGLLSMKINFISGKKNGDAIQYFPTGQVYKITPYQDDLIEGEEKCFNIDGSLSAIARYKSGKLNGTSQSWNQKGVLVFEGEYSMGKKDGKFNKYYDSGEPRVLQTFKDDQLQTKQSFDPEGNTVS